MLAAAPICAWMGLVVAQPFHIEAIAEAETRGGRLPTGDRDEIGAEFIVEPTLRGTYASQPMQLELSYGPRFFTRARGLGAEDILTLHRVDAAGNVTINPRLELTAELSGSDGAVDFSNATFALDGDIADDPTVGVLPDQPVIEYTRGRIRLGARWLPARRWVFRTRVSATAFRARDTARSATSGSPELQDQQRVTWRSNLTRQSDRDTTWGGELELSYRSFDADPIFTGATAAGTLEQRLGPNTILECWLGAHASMASRDHSWDAKPVALPVGGVTAEHTFGVTPRRRFGLDGRVELRPFHDPLFGTLDERIIVAADSMLALSTRVGLSLGAQWSNLLYVRTQPRPGQTEQVVDVNWRFSFRAGDPIAADIGIRYALQLRRQGEGDETVDLSREEMVAFLRVILSADLLGD